MVDDWPVQFLPVASPLDEEALERAVELKIEDAAGAISARVLRAEHLVATALKVGRPKDVLRVDAFLEQKAVDLGALKDILGRHNLLEAWRTFCLRTGRSELLR